MSKNSFPTTQPSRKLQCAVTTSTASIIGCFPATTACVSFLWFVEDVFGLPELAWATSSRIGQFGSGLSCIMSINSSTRLFLLAGNIATWSPGSKVSSLLSPVSKVTKTVERLRNEGYGNWFKTWQCWLKGLWLSTLCACLQCTQKREKVGKQRRKQSGWTLSEKGGMDPGLFPPPCVLFSCPRVYSRVW